MHNSIWHKLAPRTGTAHPARRDKPRFRPGLEGLEDRLVPSSGSISGHVLQDQTGNGLSADDTAWSGVAVNLYADTANTGALNSSDALVATQTSAAGDGSYAFGYLPAGTYFVKESVPADSVRTAPTNSSYYTVNLADGQAVTGQDFDNFQKLNRAAVTNISFTVIAPDGTQTTVTNLRGHTAQGDTVVANFTVTAGPTLVSLVSYNAPGSSFNAGTAGQQTIVADVSGTFQPGPQSLSVTIPNNFYQVDFVLGTAIDHFGPAGSDIFYSAQNRLLSADNGGTQPVSAATLSGEVFADNTGTGTPGNGNGGLAGAVVTLTGTSSSGQSVTLTATTDTNGMYSFTALPPGTYTLTVTLSPLGFAPEIVPGQPPGTPPGVIANVTVPSGAQLSGLNFPEVVPST
jgi:hypothetical protein